MPVDSSVVEQQIKALGSFTTFGTTKEIGELPKILAEGETILGLARGIMDNKTWLITVTDRRILFLDKGMLYGLRQLELPISQIKSVTHTTGLLFGEILVNTGGDTRAMKNMSKADVAKLAALISSLVNARQVDRSARPSVVGDDNVSKLERLAALRDRGVLNEAEFVTEKQKILAGLG